jgi:fructokinase
MFKNKNFQFTSFGEVLFDVFENEKKIGGAPLNIALRISSLGFKAAIISAVGKDENGKEILEFMRQKQVNTASVAEVPQYPTGVVKVSLDKNGVAEYEIDYPAAWDAIPFSTETEKLVKGTDVIIYGSLASRDEISRNSLLEALQRSDAMKVFDINLRPPHYNRETIQQLIQHADLIKFNEEELLEISASLGSDEISIERNMQFIKEKFKATTICVTRGSAGAVLLYNDKFYYNGGRKIQLVDTVGAGDSFLGSFLCSLLSDQDPQKALDFASVVGSIVASSAGANPEIDLQEVEAIMQKNQ